MKAHPEAGSATSLPGQLAKSAEPAAFVLTIDPDRIHVYRPAGQSLGEPIACFDTRQVLQHYDPEFPRTRVFEPYLLTLVEAWLRDLAYHWKSENPLGWEELARTDLLERLAGGTTQRLGAV